MSRLDQLAKDLPPPDQFQQRLAAMLEVLQTTPDCSDEALLKVFKTARSLTEHLVPWVNLLRLLSSPVPPRPRGQVDVDERGKYYTRLNRRARESLPDRLVPAGISVIGNHVAEVKLDDEKTATMGLHRATDGGDLEEEEEDVRNYLRRNHGVQIPAAAPPQPSSAVSAGQATHPAPDRPSVASRLVDKYLVQSFPDLKKPIYAYKVPGEAGTMTGEDVEYMREEGATLLATLRVHPSGLALKELADDVATELLLYLSAMPKNGVVAISESARNLFGRARVPDLFGLYLVFMQLNCFRSVFLPEDRVARVMERCGYRRAEVEAAEAALLHPLSPYPRYGLHFVCEGAQTLCYGNVLDYSREKTSSALQSFAMVAARSLLCESALMERDIFHQATLRLALFHVHSLRTFDYLSRTLRKRAVLRAAEGAQGAVGPEDSVLVGYKLQPNPTPAQLVAARFLNSPDFLSPFIKKLRDSNTGFDNDGLLQSNQVTLLNYLQHAPGDEHMEHERRPFFTSHAVKVLDGASLAPARMFTKFLESKTFSKFLKDPTLLFQFEGGVSDEELRLAQCLIYLFMLDFHLRGRYQTATSDGNTLEGAYVNTHLAIFPRLLDPGCLGGVQLIGRRFYVLTTAGLVDPGNQPAVLLTLVMDTLHEHSAIFRMPMRAIRRQIATTTLNQRYGERLHCQYELVDANQ